MKTILYLFLPFLILGLSCKSQQQLAVEADAVVEEVDETKDWRGNTEIEEFVNLYIEGPAFPKGKWFYLYLQPKEGIHRDDTNGKNFLIIKDEISPYPIELTLNMPRLQTGQTAINPDDQNALSNIKLSWRENYYTSDFIGGDLIIEEISPDQRTVKGLFQSSLVFEGETHQVNGVFMVNAYLRPR